jgi:uncharacterized small protein (DUF1192 family)
LEQETPMDDEDRARRRIAHEIGEKLDALSIRDFDERIALLRGEIERLESARRHKQTALDHAGSIFKV